MASSGITSTSFKEGYNFLTLHLVPGPRSVSYGAPWILVLAALLVPPEILSHRQLYLCFLPPIYASIFHACLAMGVMDVLSVQMTLWSTVLLALCDPRRDFRRVRTGSSKSNSIRKKGFPDLRSLKDQAPEAAPKSTWEEPYPQDFIQRIYWVSALLVSPRFSNWKTGELSHDRKQPAPGMTRRAYLKQVLTIIIPSLLLLDAGSFYTAIDPYFSQRISIDQALPDLSTKIPVWAALRVLPPRLVRTVALAARIYGQLSAAFLIPAVPILGLNALGLVSDEWSPHTWHMLFGSFSTMLNHGLRGFWGAWWHQISRETASRPGRALACSLGIPSSTMMGYAILIFSAFLFSGIQHAGLIPSQPLHSTMSVPSLKLHIAGFFWAQIPAFAVEITVSTLTRQYFPDFRGTFMARLLTSGWILVWMCLTFPLLAIPLREMGFLTFYPIPVSLCQWLAGNGWSTWS